MPATCNLHLYSRNHGAQTEINKCICSKGCYVNPIQWALISLTIFALKLLLFAWFDSYRKWLEPVYSAEILKAIIVIRLHSPTFDETLTHGVLIQQCFFLVLKYILLCVYTTDQLAAWGKWPALRICGFDKNPMLSLCCMFAQDIMNFIQYLARQTFYSKKTEEKQWFVTSSCISQQNVSVWLKLLFVCFWLNWPRSSATRLNGAPAVTRDLNEVVNFELTPF